MLDILRQRLPGLDADMPCANPGRLWLLRVGLYELQRPKPRADDWVWLIDHTIQWGVRKCLFVVGVRLFRQEHSTVVGTYDILHKLALFLEKLLQRAPRWAQSTRRVASCQQRTRYTRCAFLSPPTIREQKTEADSAWTLTA